MLFPLWPILTDSGMSLNISEVELKPSASADDGFLINLNKAEKGTFQPFTHFPKTNGGSFYEYTSFGKDRISAHDEFMDLANDYVKTDELEGGSLFDWESFKDAIEKQSAKELAIGECLNIPIHFRNEKANMCNVAQKLIGVLQSVLSGDIVEESKLDNKLYSSLQHFDGALEEWNQERDLERIIRDEFRIVVGIPSGQLNYFSSILITITVDGYIKKAARRWMELCHWRGRTTKELTVKVKVMSLIVAKNFGQSLSY